MSNIRLLSIGSVCPSSYLPGIWPACGVYQIHSPICEAGHACVYHINNPSCCKCRHFFRDMQEILQGFGLHILVSTSTNASMLMSLVSSGVLIWPIALFVVHGLSVMHAAFLLTGGTDLTSADAQIQASSLSRP